MNHRFHQALSNALDAIDHLERLAQRVDAWAAGDDCLASGERHRDEYGACQTPACDVPMANEMAEGARQAIHALRKHNA